MIYRGMKILPRTNGLQIHENPRRRRAVAQIGDKPTGPAGAIRPTVANEDVPSRRSTKHYVFRLHGYDVDPDYCAGSGIAVTARTPAVRVDPSSQSNMWQG